MFRPRVAPVAAVVAALVFQMMLLAPASAQEYPTRQIEIVVGFAPGGGADVAARLISGYASKKWGKPVTVVNQPGASGMTATRQVINARPDGHTLFLDVHAVSSMLFASQSDVPYRMEDKTPIALVTFDPVIYTVKADSPWKTLKEVAEAAKANPKSFRYGLGGVAAVAAFSVSQFLHAAGVPVPETNKVVFAGGAPALAALAGGHVDFAGQQWSEAAPLILGKKIRALAVVHPTRLPTFPDVPTAKEAGFPELNVVGWQGLSGPPKLPANVVAKWSALLEAASKDPEFLQQAEKVYKVIVHKGPEAFWQFQQEELKKYLPMATQIGIRK
ncbi:MAG: tripartite tricarboxylate transporter substrate binding protein [Candidatus Rokubacteria bacterium]|nr:tripartite tricarboxylate transporter substrate binding protein [Candidatus Rokubacteria bacterium]